MSNALINRSSDLKKLRDAGYEVEIRGGFLLVRSVPYFNQEKKILTGTLVSELTFAGERTVQPGTHIVHFIGEHPCNIDGTEITAIKHESRPQRLAEDLVVDHSFSNKPPSGYPDYYEKMTRYIEIISAPAESLDNKATAKTFKVIISNESDSVFQYFDSNSSRASIDLISDKLKAQKIGIIGVGGTGSYVLDLVAKTPVSEIHIFDRDEFLQHNAFRSPGAASITKLEQKPLKVDYLKGIYSKMHKQIFAHRCFITSDNTELLVGLTFVFICMDKGAAKKAIIEKLETLGISFVDVGMGVEVVDDRLLGIVRTTSSTANKRDHIHENRLISLADVTEKDDYEENIQIADLNALNASLAVIKWKKNVGYYDDQKKEHNTTYTINVGMLLNDDYET